VGKACPFPSGGEFIILGGEDMTKPEARGTSKCTGWTFYNIGII
jgi:hypothetical protein